MYQLIYFSFFVVRTIKICSLSNFQEYSMLLTLSTRETAWYFPFCACFTSLNTLSPGFIGWFQITGLNISIVECPVSSSPLPVDGHLGTVNMGVEMPVYHVDLKSHLVVRLPYLMEAIFVIFGDSPYSLHNDWTNLHPKQWCPGLPFQYIITNVCHPLSFWWQPLQQVWSEDSWFFCALLWWFGTLSVLRTPVGHL